MSKKETKKRGFENPNEPVTKQEFYNETKLIREEFKEGMSLARQEFHDETKLIRKEFKEETSLIRKEFHDETKLIRKEFHSETKLIKEDVKALKVDMFDFKTEMRNNHQSLILAMCEQTQKIIDHFDESSDKNKQEHAEMKNRISVCEKKLVIA